MKLTNALTAVTDCRFTAYSFLLVTSIQYCTGIGSYCTVQCVPASYVGITGVAI